MAGGRRGLVAPQNTFLENIIRRSNQQREYALNLLKGMCHETDRTFIKGAQA
jgi:hypothetical protein